MRESNNRDWIDVGNVASATRAAAEAVIEARYISDSRAVLSSLCEVSVVTVAPGLSKTGGYRLGPTSVY